jgi:hypothetical protein
MIRLTKFKSFVSLRKFCKFVIMDIQAEKIELAKLILSTNDTGLINQIKSLFRDKEEDWWDELPSHVKLGINESLQQANQGEFISYDEVKKEVSALLKK